MRDRARAVTGAAASIAVLAAAALAFAEGALLAGALALAGGLGMALAAWAAARSASAARRDAAALSGAMGSVAAGDYGARPGPLAHGALRGLQPAFAAMADALERVVASLAHDRRQLQAVLETMADGVVVVGAGNRVTMANAAALALLGVGGAVGRRLSESARDHELQALVAVCRDSGAKQQAELELASVRRTVTATATPLAPLTESEEAGVLLTLHDLTGLRRLETTRREFVANVSHELRSPIASVKAMVETLEGGAVADPAVAADFLQRAHREVDRMSALVDDLLELSRLESERGAVELRPVALAPVAAGVRSAMETRAAAADVAVAVEVAGDCAVLGDEGKLRQVLSNLVDNALKFTPTQGRIDVRAWPAQDGVVRVEVRDTGDGIAPEHLPHLFERFYKADRSRHGVGTGLGLAIVKHIVAMHGGEIGVDSELGVGTTVWLTLPAAVPPAP